MDPACILIRMLQTRPGQVPSNTSRATTPRPLSRAPALMSIQARPICSGSQIQASSVASRAVPKSAQGAALRGTARGENTVTIEPRLKIASAVNSQSIAKPPD